MALASISLACVAHAQEAGSVSGYRLPPATERPPAPVEGPVDRDHPVAVSAAPDQPAPEAASPAPSSSPTAAPIQPPVVQPGQRAPSQEQRVAPAEALPAPAATPSALPSALPELAPPDHTPDPAPAPGPAATARSPREILAASWLPLLAGLSMLVAAAALLWLRKRRTVVRDEAEAEPFTAPGQDAKSSAPAVLAPIGNVPRRRVPPRPLAALPLALQFEPQSLRLSFVYATLAYRLELANDGDLPLRDLRVSGDLASGHATVPVVRQLAPGAGELRNMHAVPLVEPGEILVLSGEIQSAIAEILPLRAGPALMFAPLARLRIDMQGANGKPGTETFIFTLGLPSPRQGETMQPFRLDLGPQLFRPIEQRPVDAARWLELDQLRAAG